MSYKQHILMLASENDALPGGKVGGIGDVIRDIPKALAAAGSRVTVVLPSYALFHTLPGSRRVAEFGTLFRGRPEPIEVFESADPAQHEGVRQLILHHPQFGACGTGKIYCNDGPDQPFATDASKFALFCRAALTATVDGLLGDIDVLHLHDWHAALAAVLKRYDPAFESIRNLHTVYSIHNLALQGIRPYSMHPSSLEAWFPQLSVEHSVVTDPRWPSAVNPVAAAIRLADRVHAVSPTYAREIQEPNNPERGFHGGEGLHALLQQAAQEGRLHGIINGIDYPKPQRSATPLDPVASWQQQAEELANGMLSPMARQGDNIRSVDYLAHQRLLQLARDSRPLHIMTSVGRLTAQKVAILLTRPDGQRTALELLLEQLGDDGILLLLGSGDHEAEQHMASIAARHDNFVFLCLYSDRLADALFTTGDLFLMPSSFEPCGISQMLAMRASQPCLVHDVGGLHDTVEDDVDGFSFRGDSLAAQAAAMIDRLADILAMREQHPERFAAIASCAGKQRFTWADSAQRYQHILYTS